jgi:carbamoyltransferase
MTILGLNAYHGDASAVLLSERGLECAIEEERFTRRKHEAGFPAHAVRACLARTGLDVRDLQAVAVARRPNAHLARRVLYAVSTRPGWSLLRDRLINEARFGHVKQSVARAATGGTPRLDARVYRVEHHRAHMASSFFVSPFDEAALLSIDGFGDFVSTMWGTGRGNRIGVDGWVEFPHSLGILYTATTQYLGFPNYGDEFKVMGLAPFGEPEYLDCFRRMVSDAGEKFRLDLRYFVHHRDGARMTWESGPPTLSDLFSPELERLLGPRRRPAEPIERRHQNVAASLQALLEEAVLNRLRRLAARTGHTRLCLAGGVALNCTLNGKILRETPFEDLYVQPAAHDAGTALGAALYVRHHVLGHARDVLMDHASWGVAYGRDACRQALQAHGLAHRDLAPEVLVREAAALIAAGHVLGWFQGRFEWGPRALGHRSIVCDPRDPRMKDLLNARIKHRECFRPFAPSVTAEAAHRFFDLDQPAPFMLTTCPVRPAMRSVIPAVTHVDGTARVQTVRREISPDYWALLDAFGRLTGVPVLLNTSFNENEPIVNTPDEAVRCFLRNDMDALALGPFLVVREGKRVS